jgi:hypothetical protein
VRLRKALFQLILISWLLLFSLTSLTQDVSKEEILTSFHASVSYQDYLKEQPITQQVIVTIEIIELGESIDFPNPYVARLFHLYLEDSTNLSSKRITSRIIYPPG